VNDGWTTSADQEWLDATASGSGTAQISLLADCAGLGAGVHQATVYFSSDASDYRATAAVLLFNPYQASDGVPDCGDGIDNDGDGDVDATDASCADTLGPSEVSPGLPCDNGVDDDNDGWMDFPFDPGCESSTALTEAPQCQDGIDNDADGRVDFDGGASANGGTAIADSDSACVGFSVAFESDGIEIPVMGPLGLLGLVAGLLLGAGWLLRGRVG
jgi:hypothetical protein